MKWFFRSTLPTAKTTQRRTRLNLEILESRDAPSAVAVNASANVHAIDPNIYGTAFASTAQLLDLRIPLNRNGGNASDTYSMAQDATNHANDWYFESIPLGSGNGQGIDSYVSASAAGGAQSSLTLNLFDWAAKLGQNRSNLGSFAVSKYGAQQSTDPWNSNLGNGVYPNGANITGNNVNDAYTANSPTIEQAWIQHLVSTFGDSQHGGVQYYTYGNEPGLWNSTHRDMHPSGDTLTELYNRIVSYGSMVKGVDPGAQLLGPEEWGWTNYYVSGADAAIGNYGATYDGLNAQEWLLNQLHQYNVSTGQRLLDTYTLHYYPQGGEFGNDVSTNMELRRNQSTRSLWDPNYVDQSWIASTGINGGVVNLINQMKFWVNNYYPGTKLGITEYNWGAEGNMNGATTQADIWGIFGREGLDLANRWTTPDTGSPAYLAMKMFRNYDGAGSAFGDTSVGASVANPDQVDAFAATRSADGALTVMVINKNLYSSSNPTATTSITVNLSGFAGNGTAQAWQLAAINPSNQNNAAISHLADIHFTGNSFTINVPMESVSLFTILPVSAAPGTPTGLTAQGGDSKATLSWTAAGGAASYSIYRGVTSGAETLLKTGVTGTTFTDTGLTNGTTYFYQVTAVNTVGESSRSTEASVMPQSGVPAAPSGLLATAASSSQINLTWLDNSTNETGYAVEWATNSTFTTGDTTANLGANATGYSVTGLAASTAYWFRVHASNASGASVNSNSASTTTLASAVSGTGLAATYYNNMDFTGTTVQRIDPTINFNWGKVSPVAGISAGTYSARWLGQVQAVGSGNYRFQTVSDDGIRLWVNGKLIIDNWTNHGATTNTSAAVSLTAGQQYSIQVDYYQNSGAAVMQLSWLRPSKTTYAIIPQTQLYPPATGNGLHATYFANADLTGTTVARTDPAINFNWGAAAPAAGISASQFSARWTGQIQAVESGTYSFQSYSEGGVRIWVNGQLIINDWTAHSASYDTGTISLQAGQKYDIRVEYWENTGNAVMQLAWQRPGQSGFTAIPQANLFS